tara:strand:- start:286 stop:501 length:216 start_codon:yes stop_codon:yes gene_type:complete
MTEQQKYQLGESIVNKNNLKMGRIVDAAETENGFTEAVEIEYEGGFREWVSADNVARLLLEVDPPKNNELL